MISTVHFHHIPDFQGHYLPGSHYISVFLCYHISVLLFVCFVIVVCGFSEDSKAWRG